jgi:hypothetical protein
MSKSKQQNAKALPRPKITPEEKTKQQQAGRIFAKMAKVKAMMYVKGKYK